MNSNSPRALDFDPAYAISKMCDKLGDYLENAGLKSMILGVSGGADSLLAAIICSQVAKETGIPLYCISLPCKSKQEETDRARRVGKFFGTSYFHFNLEGWYNQQIDDLETEFGIAPAIPKGNIKARDRMEVLYHLAWIYKGIVISTDNLTEYMLGFWTKHGDEGDIGPFQNLWKTEVYECLEWVASTMDSDAISDSGIAEIIEANPTDGLGVSNTDFDQFGVPEHILKDSTPKEIYSWVEMPLRIIYDGYTPKLENAGEHKKIVELYLKTQYKRNGTYNIPRESLIL